MLLHCSVLTLPAIDSDISMATRDFWNVTVTTSKGDEYHFSLKFSDHSERQQRRDEKTAEALWGESRRMQAKCAEESVRVGGYYYFLFLLKMRLDDLPPRVEKQGSKMGLV